MYNKTFFTHKSKECNVRNMMCIIIDLDKYNQATYKSPLEKHYNQTTLVKGAYQREMPLF